MNQQQFNELVQKVLSKGVIVTMQMDKDSGIIWYDMNTDMKSELLIAYDGEKCIFKARYGKWLSKSLRLEAIPKKPSDEYLTWLYNYFEQNLDSFK